MKLDNPFVNDFSSKKAEIESIIRDHWIAIDQYEIAEDDIAINVIGNVKFSTHMNYLAEIPLVFNVVTGNFDCSRLKLTTLKNSPKEVGGNFDCTYNQLSSLEYAPKKVEGTFAFDNMVKSIFTGDRSCNFNQVALVFRTNNPKLIGLPKIITDNIGKLATVFRYQHYYSIWNQNGSFNVDNMMGLIEDIEDGLE
jgi:hypothetical protein